MLNQFQYNGLQAGFIYSLILLTVYHFETVVCPSGRYHFQVGNQNVYLVFGSFVAAAAAVGLIPVGLMARNTETTDYCVYFFTPCIFIANIALLGSRYKNARIIEKHDFEKV